MWNVKQMWTQNVTYWKNVKSGVPTFTSKGLPFSAKTLEKSKGLVVGVDTSHVPDWFSFLRYLDASWNLSTSASLYIRRDWYPNYSGPIKIVMPRSPELLYAFTIVFILIIASCLLNILLDVMWMYIRVERSHSLHAIPPAFVQVAPVSIRLLADFESLPVRKSAENMSGIQTILFFWRPNIKTTVIKLRWSAFRSMATQKPFRMGGEGSYLRSNTETISEGLLLGK